MALRILYYLYERRLLRQVQPLAKPKHVGIILDGNRRYAREIGVTDPRRIYATGANKLDEVLDWCVQLAIPAVTLWVLSTENLSRSSEEVAGILSAVEAKITSLIDDPRIHRQRVRVRAIGELELLPSSTREVFAAAQRATAAYNGMELNIAIGYGGREEIVDAVRAVLRAFDQSGTTLRTATQLITPESIGRHLYTAGLPDPDLIIRTSGEVRLSGFLLWQSAHSEFYFSDVNWPEFRRIDFLRAVRDFQRRKRRYGL